MKGGYDPKDFDPRAIQATSHKANVALGPFMWKTSKELCKIWNSKSRIFYTSGSTAEEIGEWRGQFADDVVTIIEIDASRYDAHQGTEAHRTESIFYSKTGIQNYPEASFVFDAQRNTVGFSSHGVFYRVPGKRKSGDPNTSCGNSINNGCCAEAIFIDRFPDLRMLVNGDDNLLVTRFVLTQDEMISLRNFVIDEYFKLGFAVKVKISTRWSKVEFCSSLFWPVEDGFVLGPKIGRRLPKIGFSLRKLPVEQVKGMLLGLMKETKYIPILSDYARLTLKHLSKIKKENYYDYESQYKSRVTLNHKPCLQTELFFLDRYGIDVGDAVSSFAVVMKRIEREFTAIIDWPDLDLFLFHDL